VAGKLDWAASAEGSGWEGAPETRGASLEVDSKVGCSEVYSEPERTGEVAREAGTVAAGEIQEVEAAPEEPPVAAPEERGAAVEVRQAR
jgi:hypothetical protein